MESIDAVEIIEPVHPTFTSFRQAIDPAQIASVGERNPQISEPASRAVKLWNSRQPQFFPLLKDLQVY